MFDDLKEEITELVESGIPSHWDVVVEALDMADEDVQSGYREYACQELLGIISQLQLCVLRLYGAVKQTNTEVAQ